MESMKKPIKNASDAVGFLYQTYFDAHLILNPDLGFLKADNTSAFSKLDNYTAQLAQARLIECEEILTKAEVDAWEICMEFHIVKAHLDFAQHQNGSSDLFTDEWVDVLRKWGDDGYGGRSISMLAEESEEHREERRNAIMFNLISKVHAKHPALKGAPTHHRTGTREALLICESILPHGWIGRINELMRNAHGNDPKFHHETFQSSLDEIPENVRKNIDDTLLELGDYDDDPTKGMEW